MTNEVSKYLTVEEIERCNARLSEAYPTICLRFALPFPSVEGRTLTGLRIGSSIGAATPALLALGGVHAREWVPPDALVYLAADVLEAYKKGVGLRYGKTYFCADKVKDLVNKLGLVVVPCVNPDGRIHSQTVFPLWRGNRKIVHRNSESSYGVDLNRNYDFLWDFRRCFHSEVIPPPASDDAFAVRQNYHGSAACSEPETRNIVSLYELFPIRVLVDVHSYGPVLLRSWGNDENQSSNPSMNFMNATYDGQRGLTGSSDYKEFIPERDEMLAAAILRDAATAANGVDGQTYECSPAWTMYPTSGAGDDYAYSRHFKTNTDPKVLSFTMECASSFQPDFPAAARTMQEVAAGILAVGTSVLARDGLEAERDAAAIRSTAS